MQALHSAVVDEEFQKKILIKVGLVAFFIILLTLPLQMINGVREERETRRNGVVAEISRAWGESQRILSPLLVLEYDIPDPSGAMKYPENTPVMKTNRAFIAPHSIQFDGELTPEVRARGIYEAVLYRSEVKISGTFKLPSTDELQINPQSINWDKSFVFMTVTDVRGLRGTPTISFGDATKELRPAGNVSGEGPALQAMLNQPISKDAETKFNISLNLQGSDYLDIVPLGASNTVKLRSAWNDPSFAGEFLPSTRTVSEKGFDAEWNISEYNLGSPRFWIADGAYWKHNSFQTIRTRLYSSVDGYQSVDRSIKYGILTLVMIFTAFFLFELVANVRIHLLQYGIVGAALVLFFLSLLSFVEVTVFGLAFFGAAAISTTMISLYSWGILKTKEKAAIIAGLLSLTYGFLYVILRMEDFSLICGSLGLTAALGAVMFVTRGINAAPQVEEVGA